MARRAVSQYHHIISPRLRRVKRIEEATRITAAACNNSREKSENKVVYHRFISQHDSSSHSSSSSRISASHSSSRASHGSSASHRSSSSYNCSSSTRNLTTFHRIPSDVERPVLRARRWCPTSTTALCPTIFVHVHRSLLGARHTFLPCVYSHEG